MQWFCFPSTSSISWATSHWSMWNLKGNLIYVNKHIYSMDPSQVNELKEFRKYFGRWWRQFNTTVLNESTLLVFVHCKQTLNFLGQSNQNTGLMIGTAVHHSLLWNSFNFLWHLAQTSFIDVKDHVTFSHVMRTTLPGRTACCFSSQKNIVFKSSSATVNIHTVTTQIYNG